MSRTGGGMSSEEVAAWVRELAGPFWEVLSILMQVTSQAWILLEKKPRFRTVRSSQGSRMLEMISEIEITNKEYTFSKQ